jgi:hypothetical protein
MAAQYTAEFLKESVSKGFWKGFLAGSGVGVFAVVIVQFLAGALK